MLVWRIPDEGLTETLREPEFKLQGAISIALPDIALFCTGHREKANILCFHPLASDVLATSGYDGKILIWNINKQQVEISLDPTQEPVRFI